MRAYHTDIAAPTQPLQPAPVGAPADTPPALRFRPDIEGLRAVAVVIVLLYHAGITGFSGGYVGVDVFFVLSGFLITSLLDTEIARTGRVRLGAFYARRIRRLLPASCLVLVATLVLSAAFLPPLQQTSLRRDATATALYVSNVRFAIDDLDYLRVDEESPFLHYWSLAVEEHFYLVWPALLLAAAALAARARRNRRRAVAVVLGVLVVGSFAASVLLTPRNAPYAFFLLPTRAWEFGAGAALGLARGHAARLSPSRTRVAAWSGVVLLAFATVLFDDRTPFPGSAAAVPVVATLLLLAAGTSPTPTAVGRALGTGPFQRIGGLSYSLYLWHWPLLVVAGATAAEPTRPVPQRLAVLLLAGLLSWVTFRLLEHPVRRSTWLRARPLRSLALGVGLTATGVLAARLLTAPPTLATDVVVPPAASSSLADLVADPTPVVPANLRPSLLDARADVPTLYADGCHRGFLTTSVDGCVFGAEDATTTVALLGDSHAAQWFPALERLADQHGWRLLSLTKSGCPAPVLTVFNESLNRTYTECDQWRDAALARLADEAPQAVVVTSFDKGRETGGLVDPDAWLDGLAELVDRLPATSQVLWLGDTPLADEDPLNCLSEHLHDAPACSSLDSPEARDLGRREAQVVEAAGGHTVDVTSAICRDGRCPPILGDLLVYRDLHHLTATFADHLAPLLDEPLRAAVQAAQD